MPSMPKLTKRAKKAIAFRDRKGKSKRTPNTEQENDVPILEHQVDTESGFDGTQGEEDDEASTRTFGGDRAGKSKEERGLVESKKRQREAREETQGPDEHPKPKRRRGSGGGSVVDVVDGEGEKQSEVSKRRFILFLGTILESLAVVQFPLLCSR